MSWVQVVVLPTVGVPVMMMLGSLRGMLSLEKKKDGMGCWKTVSITRPGGRTEQTILTTNDFGYVVDKMTL